MKLPMLFRRNPYCNSTSFDDNIPQNLTRVWYRGPYFRALTLIEPSKNPSEGLDPKRPEAIQGYPAGSLQIWMF